MTTVGDVVVTVFALVWWMRSNTVEMAPTTTAYLLEIAALLLGTVAGWLGGELVDRLGVGVDSGAHLDAPNSLSGRPAPLHASAGPGQRRQP